MAASLAGGADTTRLPRLSALLHRLQYPVSGERGRLVLPDSETDPPGSAQAFSRVAVPYLILGDLGAPPLGVRLRLGAVIGAAMPEATVDEHRYLDAAEDDVGLTSQIR